MAVTHARRQAALGGIIWNSFEASFVTADERRRFIDELDGVVGADASPSPDVGIG